MTPAERIAAIRERAERATEGPWEGVLEAPEICVLHPGSRKHIGCYFNEDEDVDFIAHARADVPWLLDQVEFWKFQASGSADAITELRRILGMGNASLTETAKTLLARLAKAEKVVEAARRCNFKPHTDLGKALADYDRGDE